MSNVQSTVGGGSAPLDAEKSNQDRSVGAQKTPFGDGILGMPLMDPARLAFLLRGLNLGDNENIQLSLFDKKGKPNLGVPNLGSSDEGVDDVDVSALLAKSQAAIARINAACARTAMNGVEILSTRVKVANEERHAELAKWVTEQNKLAADARGPFGWLIAIFKAIAAFFATVITLMLAIAFPNPLTIAAAVLAIAALVASVVEIAGKISLAAGGPSFTLATLIPVVMTALFTAFGMEESKAKEMGNFIGGILSLPACLVDTSGLAPFIDASMQMSGMDQETIEKTLPWLALAMTVLISVLTTALSIMSGNATGSMQVASTSIRALYTTATIVGLGVMAASSAQSIQQGILTSTALEAQSTARTFQAIVEFLTNQRQISQDSLSKLLDIIGKAAECWGKSIESLFGAEKVSIRRMA